MKNVIFKGIATAIITPTYESGVDYKKFGRLIDWQIAEGIDALVVCGTTGEASTLTDKEHKEAMEFAVSHVAGKVPVIVGTGSNETAYAIELTKAASSYGADAALVVTPYYNKATQNGLIKTFSEIAECSDLPIVLYNVPSRTGVNIEPSTYEVLSHHENIVGIKEASGNISKIVETMSLIEGRLALYSGNDDQIVPLMALGGLGCISVLSNMLPAQTREIYTKFFEGDIQGSAELQCKYHNLISALFCEVNPIPIKAALSAMGYCENYLRLPLTEMEEKNYNRLISEMRNYGIQV